MKSYETHNWHFISTDRRAMDMQDPKSYGSILHKAFKHLWLLVLKGGRSGTNPWQVPMENYAKEKLTCSNLTWVSNFVWFTRFFGKNSGRCFCFITYKPQCNCLMSINILFLTDSLSVKARVYTGFQLSGLQYLLQN